MFKNVVYPTQINFIPAYVHWKCAVIVFVALLMCCILDVLTGCSNCHSYMTVRLGHQKTMRMELENCCKVDIRVNSPLSSSLFGSRFGTMRLGHYIWHVDSYIFLLVSYSIRFILVRSCEIWVVFFLCSIFKPGVSL